MTDQRAAQIAALTPETAAALEARYLEEMRRRAFRAAALNNRPTSKQNPLGERAPRVTP